MGSGPTKLLLVEDVAGARAALTTALEASGVEVVGAFATGEAAVAEVVHLKPDVALVDLGLPGISGVEVIRRMRALLPELPVLVLTFDEREDVIVDAIEAGAKGYLLKGTPFAELRQAIEQVREGLAPLSPRVARHLLSRVREKGERAPTQSFDLSDREREVLSLLVRGHTYASIAGALGIQLGTVQSHVKNVYKKLEVSSKAEAAWLAVQHGLVPDAKG